MVQAITPQPPTSSPTNGAFDGSGRKLSLHTIGEDHRDEDEDEDLGSESGGGMGVDEESEEEFGEMSAMSARKRGQMKKKPGRITQIMMKSAAGTPKAEEGGGEGGGEEEGGGDIDENDGNENDGNENYGNENENENEDSSSDDSSDNGSSSSDSDAEEKEPRRPSIFSVMVQENLETPESTDSKKKPEPERKPSVRLTSVRRKSLVDIEHENNEEEKDTDDDNAGASDPSGGEKSERSENGSEDEEDEGEGKEPRNKRRSISEGAAEMYRRNSHMESIKAMRLREVYLKNAAAEGDFAKTAKGRWLNAIRTVLRGVRAVNAFLPQEYRRKKKEAENKKMGKKKTAWQKVKKTAVQHAVQNRMAQEFKVNTESAAKQVGFQFGKSADKKLFENCLRILKTEKKRRTRPDLGMLLALLKDNQFFSKLSHEVKLDLASVMSLSSVKHGVNVFKQGDVGNLFYIVLRGECDVFVTHMGISFKAVTYGVGGGVRGESAVDERTQGGDGHVHVELRLPGHPEERLPEGAEGDAREGVHGQDGLP